MNTAWLFPGQGSQYCGMGRDLWANFEPALEVLNLAEELSGFPLRTYSLMGPAETLMRTRVLQPALTAVNIGCAMWLAEAGYEVSATAGHSLGEFSALFAAGVLTVEDTLSLVVKRGQLMEQAASENPGGMLAVKGIPVSRINGLAEATSGITVGNYNSPDQTVVSGSSEALAAFAQKCSLAGGQTVALPVSGAWHSCAMEGAAKEFAWILDKTEFRDAHCPVFANVPGRAITRGTELREYSKQQMTASVRWHQSIEEMRKAGHSTFFEVGPGKVLRGLMRRICRDESAYSIRNIESPRSLVSLSQLQKVQSA